MLQKGILSGLQEIPKQVYFKGVLKTGELLKTHVGSLFSEQKCV